MTDSNEGRIAIDVDVHADVETIFEQLAQQLGTDDLHELLTILQEKLNDL